MNLITQYPRLSLNTLIAIFLFLTIQLSAQSLVRVFNLRNEPYFNSAYGLTSDSSSIYLSSRSTGTFEGWIYQFNPTGAIIDSFSTGLDDSQGLAWTGSHFWYFKRATPAKFYKITPAGAVVDSIATGTSYIGGCYWDGTGLWYSVYYPNNEAALYKLDVNTNTVVDTIPTIGTQPQGITFDGQYYYYSMDNNDGDQENIYIYDPTIEDTVGHIPIIDPISTSPRGLAWDSQYLWLVADPVGLTQRALFKFDLAGSGWPNINLPVSLVDFGGVRIGHQKTIDATIQNVGTAPLAIDSIAFTLSSNFATTLVTPDSIQPNSSLQMPVTFSPVAFGTDSAHALIYSSDPIDPVVQVIVRGDGIYGDAIISSPASYNYGSRRVGSSNSWVLEIQNQGGGILSISSITNSDPAFYTDSLSYPVLLDSLESRKIRVWFNPSAASSYLDTLKITSNAQNGPVTNVNLQGMGDATSITIGNPLWTFTVPDHPISNTFRLVKGVRAIGDITGDGKSDVVVSTENYWTMALNGNASVSTDSIWAFTTYISSYSAGSIGTTGDYSHQKALAIASDLDGDSINDVVIGTGGGNEHVYALSGADGEMIWTYGTDHPDSFGLGDFTGVDAYTDFTNDGVPDVVAAAAATASGGLGGRRKVYLFNGTNGNIIWQAPLLGFTHGVISIDDITGDGAPDVVGAVGEAAYKATAFNGLNGQLLWDFPLNSSTGGGKELMPFPVAGETPDVILGAFWGPVYRIDGETGTEVWNRPTGGSGVLQFSRLKDVTGDGVDEILVALLVGGTYCLNGLNGTIVWSLPTGNTMGIASIPDLNQDGFDEAVIAVQNEGAKIAQGNDGVQIGIYTGFGSNQTREVAIVPDMDDNNSMEIIAGSRLGNIALISGGLDANPVSVRDNFAVPQKFSLGQNYPNPFNPSTTIEIDLPVRSDLSLTIFDILGRQIKSYEFERVPPGTHRVVWDGKDQSGAQVASGVYFYRAKTDDYLMTRRMILMR